MVLAGLSGLVKNKVLRRDGSRMYRIEWSEIRRNDILFVETDETPGRFVGPLTAGTNAWRNSRHSWTFNCSPFLRQATKFIYIPPSYWSRKNPGDMLAVTVRNIV